MCSDLLLCTGSDTFRILAFSEIYLFMYTQAYLSIFSIIQTYSCILRDYWDIFRFIQAYSELCVTLIYSQSCHTPSPVTLRTRGIFKTLSNFDQAQSITLPYSGIFRNLCYPHICRNLIYLESCNIQNLFIIASLWTIKIQNPGILTFLQYSEP